MENNTRSKQSASSLRNILYTIVAVFVILAVVAGTYHILKDTQTNDQPKESETENQNNQDGTTDNSVPEDVVVAETIEVGPTPEEIAQNQKELDFRMVIYQAFVDEIMPVLSADRKTDLALVESFINSNNSALMEDPATFPEDIRLAIQNVKDESKTKLGSIGIYYNMELTAEEINALEMPLPTLRSVGDSFSGQGQLEVVQTAEENLFGTLFRIVDNGTGAAFYLMFGENKTNSISGFVGSEVTYSVRVVEYDSEKKITNVDVTAGPSLIPSEDDETTEINPYDD